MRWDSFRIRVDANGGWSLTGRRTRWGGSRHTTWVCGQPCASVEELADLRKRWRAAESMCPSLPTSRSARPRIPLRVRDLEAADLRRQGRSLGSVANALRIVDEWPTRRRVVPSTPASGSPAGVALMAVLPASTTPVGSARWGSSTAMSRRTLVLVGGLLPQRRVTPDPRSPDALGRTTAPRRLVAGNAWSRRTGCSQPP